ncbi:hypothetical protein ACN47E_003170 [Coniothyrium glycines]
MCGTQHTALPCARIGCRTHVPDYDQQIGEQRAITAYWDATCRALSSASEYATAMLASNALPGVGSNDGGDSGLVWRTHAVIVFLMIGLGCYYYEDIFANQNRTRFVVVWLILLIIVFSNGMIHPWLQEAYLPQNQASMQSYVISHQVMPAQTHVSTSGVHCPKRNTKCHVPWICQDSLRHFRVYYSRDDPNLASIQQKELPGWAGLTDIHDQEVEFAAKIVHYTTILGNKYQDRTERISTYMTITLNRLASVDLTMHGTLVILHAFANSVLNEMRYSQISTILDAIESEMSNLVQVTILEEKLVAKHWEQKTPRYWPTYQAGDIRGKSPAHQRAAKGFKRNLDMKLEQMMEWDSCMKKFRVADATGEKKVVAMRDDLQRRLQQEDQEEEEDHPKRSVNLNHAKNFKIHVRGKVQTPTDLVWRLGGWLRNADSVKCNFALKDVYGMQ